MSELAALLIFGTMITAAGLVLVVIAMRSLQSHNAELRQAILSDHAFLLSAATATDVQARNRLAMVVGMEAARARATSGGAPVTAPPVVGQVPPPPAPERKGLRMTMSGGELSGGELSM